MSHQSSNMMKTGVGLIDRFDDRRAPGTVVGSRSTGDALRLGADRERRLSIDPDGLRIAQPARPGWGRHGIAYEAFRRQPGFAFAVALLNGHNGSQTTPYLAPSRMRGLLAKMAGRVNRHVNVSGLVGRIRGEAAVGANNLQWPPLRENLAVGWFPNDAVRNPGTGHGFWMQADDINNARLLVGTDRRLVPVLQNVPNLPMCYVVVLRAEGAAYYAASLRGAQGLTAVPHVRPLFVDSHGAGEMLHPAVFQSVLGELQWTADSRVYAAAVQPVSDWATWYGTATFADQLTGAGALGASLSTRGPAWTVVSGAFERTTSGTISLVATSHATQRMEAPAGLVHVIVEVDHPGERIGITWRGDGTDTYWMFVVDARQSQLFIVQDGVQHEVATSADGLIRGENALQITDDGATMSVYLNGAQVFGRFIEDERLDEGTEVGLYASAAHPDIRFRKFEAHSRAIPLPDALNIASFWEPPEGSVVYATSFTDQAQDLNGWSESGGDAAWEKVVGEGQFHLQTEGGLRVQGSVDQPIPGRTIYTIPWDDPSFADLEIRVVPPGSDAQQGEKGRAGVVFWQDADNYFIVNTYLDDWTVGKSVSTFFRLHGEEDLFKAVWTNVGDRIHWGEAYTLRVACDGVQYLVYVNDEPVLYRALADVYPEVSSIKIRRVGIAANWEFGNDTGSLFERFRARAQRAEVHV